LLNANAKRVGPRVRKAFEQIVPKDDLFFSSTLAEAEGHAKTIIDRRYTTVLAGGGDGTISNTMNMLLRASERAGRQHRQALPDLGILRLGTGNGLGDFSGAGRPIDDVQRILNGERPVARPLRLIEDVKTGWVCHFASMGYDAQVLNDYVDVCSSASSDLARSLSKTLAGYFYALGAKTIPHELKNERTHVRIVSTGRASIMDPETDEEIPLAKGATLFEGIARSISGGTSPYYGFGLCVHPFARRRMDRFHLRVSSASIGYLLGHLPSLWKGKLRHPTLVDFLVEGVTIESSKPMPLQIAGDARGHTDRLELRLSDRAFRVLEGTGRAKIEA
jgi:diacylglycerol kinase family enzyme